jgi:hypothetical protein
MMLYEGVRTGRDPNESGIRESKRTEMPERLNLFSLQALHELNGNNRTFASCLSADIDD